MKTAVEHTLQSSIVEIEIGLAHEEMAFAFGPVHPRQCIEMLAKRLVAIGQAARETLVEDKEFHDPPRIDVCRIQPAIGAIA